MSATKFCYRSSRVADLVASNPLDTQTIDVRQRQTRPLDGRRDSSTLYYLICLLLLLAPPRRTTPTYCIRTAWIGYSQGSGSFTALSGKQAGGVGALEYTRMDIC